VTCYQRHLGWMFEALDLPYDKDNRRRVDTAIKQVLGLDTETHCPEVWSAIKALPQGELESLVPELSAKLSAETS
jgi:hypothetical protein